MSSHGIKLCKSQCMQHVFLTVHRTFICQTYYVCYVCHAGASGDVDDGDGDVEWMDSEPMPESQLPSQLPASLRSSANGGSGALKPPLPPAASARPSSRPPVKQPNLPASGTWCTSSSVSNWQASDSGPC